MFFHLVHISLFSHFARFCVCFYVLGETAISPSLEGVAIEDESYHSTLLWVLFLGPL